ncbi:MAG: ExbD/TolR family protein [Pseudomonadota bacterium]
MGASLQGRSAGRSRRGRARAAPMSEINVTPFVDVMLVLLIIFMVAAPLLTTGVEVNLPETTAEALPTEQEEPLLVSVDAQGVVYIQREAQPLEGLQAKLSAIREARGESGGKVFYRADNTLSHGYAQEILAMLRNARFNAISIVHDQQQAGATE